MEEHPKPKKPKKPITEDSKIEKLINQRDAVNKGLEKILKKMSQKNENK